MRGTGRNLTLGLLEVVLVLQFGQLGGETSCADDSLLEHRVAPSVGAVRVGGRAATESRAIGQRVCAG